MSSSTRRQRSPPPPYGEIDNISPRPADAPPPYRDPPSYAAATAAQNTTMDTTSRSRAAPVASPRGITVPNNYINIPRVVTAYWPKRNVSNEFCLGEEPGKLLFRVSTGDRNSPHPLLALYVGPAENGLALGKLHKPDSRRGQEDGLIEIFSPASTRRTMVHMTTDVHLTHITRPFTMVVGRGRHERAEVFEWRRSRGAEIHTIDGDKLARGYKLLRLNTDAPTGGHGGKRAERPIGESSDGKEVVAVWVTNDYKGEPGRKPFQFRLSGNGVTGVLGPHFAFVALMTALKIWIVEDPGNPITRPPAPHYGHF
ncbi:hypothetical protein GGR53DRAFT_497748 [Hypoxylon sp. FL1150]|nr:hypothetical protein GGR53DRAFT_497748 [Hypoxylon sp. FL1150]